MSFILRPSGSARRRGVREQRDLAGVLDGDGNPALLLYRQAGYPARPNLAALGYELPQCGGVFVVDVLSGAERIRLLLRDPLRGGNVGHGVSPRYGPALTTGPRNRRLEGWIFGLGGAPGIRALLPAGADVAAGRSAGSPRVLAVVAAASTGRTAAAAPLAPSSVTRHLRCGVLQGRPDLVDIDLEDGTALALSSLVAAGAQPAVDDDPHSLLQRLGDVFGRLPPHGAVQEHCVTVAPLIGLAVERAGSRRDGEVGHCGT